MQTIPADFVDFFQLFATHRVMDKFRSVKWQEKVKIFMKGPPSRSLRSVARLIKSDASSLKRALETPDGWDTVHRAIRLASLMDTSVEYLFDPDTDWPTTGEIKSGLPDEQMRQAAISALQAMGPVGAEALERIARGYREGSTREASPKREKRNRR